MSNLLQSIIERKKQRLEEQRKNFPLPNLEQMLAAAPPVRDFYASLLKKDTRSIPVIAEFKRKSPSRGEIRSDLNPAELAQKYEAAGARAVSILCEQDFFAGSLDDLRAAKKNCALPLLCKDFIISSFQVMLSRIYGADLVLLIASALAPKKLDELFILTKELQMTPLIEVHDRAELEQALALGARLIGINNRNLATLEVSLDTTKTLLPLIPHDRLVISESGFTKRKELEIFHAAGVSGFLIGGSILASPEPQAKLRELVYGQG